MLCERCKKNEANVHISKNINGKAAELHMCEKCARESGELLSMNQFLGNFFESVLPLRVRRVAFMPADAHAYNRYAGCEDCVENLPAYNPPDTEFTPVIKNDEVAALRVKLNEAVVNEDFERAAVLRDEIKKLEGK